MVGLVLVAFLAAVACCGYFLWMKMRGAEMVGAAGTKLFLVEFVVVVVPYFAVVFVGTGALVVVGATSGVWSFLGALLLAVAAVTPMICGFRLSLTYLRKGRDALRRGSRRHTCFGIRTRARLVSTAFPDSDTLRVGSANRADLLGCLAAKLARNIHATFARLHPAYTKSAATHRGPSQ